LKHFEQFAEGFCSNVGAILQHCWSNFDAFTGAILEQLCSSVEVFFKDV